MIRLYETARRNWIALATAKQRLLRATQARFPKSHPVSKAMLRICLHDPTHQIRFMADVSACASADKYGDAVFRREVDGIRLPAVTHWFYGLDLPQERQYYNRTKTFYLEEARILEDVGAKAQAFVLSVGSLPSVMPTKLSREVKNFDELLAKARTLVQRFSPMYFAYLCLRERLPSYIALNIAKMSCEEPRST